MLNLGLNIPRTWETNSKLQIVQIGDPVLYEIARELSAEEISSPKIQQLITLMITTMRNKNGTSLTATQIGFPVRLIVAEDREGYQKTNEVLNLQERGPIPVQVIINPQIMRCEGQEVDAYESCLSVKNFYGIVRRHETIQIEYRNEKGERLNKEVTGRFARVVQHAMDHLHGKRFTDIVLGQSLTTKKNYLKFWKGREIEECLMFARDNWPIRMKREW